MDDNAEELGHELDEETKEILRERMKTFKQDKRDAVDACEALREIRAKLKYRPM